MTCKNFTQSIQENFPFTTSSYSTVVYESNKEKKQTLFVLFLCYQFIESDAKYAKTIEHTMWCLCISI